MTLICHHHHCNDGHISSSSYCEDAHMSSYVRPEAQSRFMLCSLSHCSAAICTNIHHTLGNIIVIIMYDNDYRHSNMHKCSMNTVHDQCYHLNNHISWQIIIKICHRYQCAQIFIILLASINDKNHIFSVVLIIYNTSSTPHHGIHQSPLHAFYPRQVFQHYWKSKLPRKVYSLGINILAQFISWKYFENAISRAEAVASHSKQMLKSSRKLMI